MTEEGIIHLIW